MKIVQPGAYSLFGGTKLKWELISRNKTLPIFSWIKHISNYCYDLSPVPDASFKHTDQFNMQNGTLIHWYEWNTARKNKQIKITQKIDENKKFQNITSYQTFIHVLYLRISSFSHGKYIYMKVAIVFQPVIYWSVFIFIFQLKTKPHRFTGIQSL